MCHSEPFQAYTRLDPLRKIHLEEYRLMASPPLLLLRKHEGVRRDLGSSSGIISL